jgi:hypothetical protein
MAPEQVAETASHADYRSDIYGLGVVLFELLTGRSPFTASDTVDLRNAILAGQVISLRTINPTIPVFLERVCLKAMAEEPGARYAAAVDLAAALRAVSNRRRPTWLLVGSALLALTAALVFGVWKWRGPPTATVEPSRPVTPTEGTVDLLSLIDPAKDTIRGNWRIIKGQLHSAADEIAHINLPCRPSDEYSLTVVAERKTLPMKGHGTFGLGLTQQGHPVLLQFDLGGDTTRLSGTNLAHTGVVFRQGRPRTIVCTCRRNSLIVTVDGKQVITWSGDFKTLGSEITERPNEYGMRIISRNSHFVISKIELTILSGPGSPVR